MHRNHKRLLLGLFLLLGLALSACRFILPWDPAPPSPEPEISIDSPQQPILVSEPQVSLDDLPDYSGAPYAVVNDSVPYFTDAERVTVSYAYYSELDSLGRCGSARANIGLEHMPTEERGPIGQIKPAGWQTIRYDFIQGKYLYNRCHLIGYQLAGENDNPRNLITGTRYLNTVGMLYFENLVGDYVRATENHVLYRVTPLFEGENLVASGVLMEALSVEDAGKGLRFNVYCYNVQPGVTIDYRTGESWAEEPSTPGEGSVQRYVLNTRRKKFHRPTCPSVETIAPANREEYTGTSEDLLAQGYSPCGRCQPE